MIQNQNKDIQAVLNFWFHETAPKQWFVKDDSFDETIRKRFGPLHQKAQQCELFPWRHSPQGRLAEIIILDQFSRNLYRNSPLAFASDPLALMLAQEMVFRQEDQQLPEIQRSFVYLPYMHSESRLIHEEAMVLFDQKGLEMNYAYEVKHKRIIDRFGRYPHRNRLLGRESTAEELAFLQGPDSSF